MSIPGYAGCLFMRSTNNVHAYAHIEAPSQPQELRSRVLEYYSNHSTVEVTWKPPDNDSRVEYYLYQVIDSLEGVNMSYEANTTNTTVILSDVLNILFILSANNCEGKSAPAFLVINIGKIIQQ